MPRRLLALVVTALVGLVGAGCADDVSPALRIGDTKIGNEAFLDEVAEWAGNPVAIDPSVLAGSSPGTYPLELVRQLLQQRIDFELHNQEFEALGLELDDDLRDGALAALFGDPSASVDAFSAFSDEFAQQFTDDIARQIAVEQELGPNEYNAWRAEAYAEADIEVSPRYGTWDGESGQITPPQGPIGSATTQPAFGQ
ncbi:MAG: hypothetical protein ACRDYW_10925 [Acidimicrobiales bacterium]